MAKPMLVRHPLWLTLPALVTLACGDNATTSDPSDSASTGTDASTSAPTTTEVVPTTTEAETSSTGEELPDDAAVTYYRDVKPVLDKHCGHCHRPGEVAPFSLTTYDEAKPFAPILADSVETATMPPWPPDNTCRTYHGDPSLDAATISLLRTWADLGAPAGNPDDAPPHSDAPVDPIAYDVELALPQPYTPTVFPDDYRCFILDWPATEDRYITGLSVTPGDRSIVHHVIAFAIDPQDVPTYRGLEDADPDPGYLCYGGPGGTDESFTGVPWLGSWVPGSTGGAMPEGTGIRVRPGSVIVMQMHYHGYPGSAADQSTLRLRTTDSVDRRAVIMPFTDIAWVTGTEPMHIPAGDPNVTHSFEYDMTTAVSFLFPDGPLKVGQPFVIHNAALHQHTLGTRSRLSVQRGGSEECLLDIPNWSFDWQGNYTLRDKVTVNPGDRIRIECSWDNSAANQPVVDGKQLEPQNVGWGEGTRDEMCLGMMYVTTE